MLLKNQVLNVEWVGNLDFFVFLHELAYLAKFENIFQITKILKTFPRFFNI